MLLRADSLASTHAIAAALARLARVGDVIVLAGDMGTGKTAFAQGFGAALGIDEPITSPTFTLVHSYPVPGDRRTLHHADLYRLETTGDVEELALDELAEFDGIVLVEWGDVVAGGLGEHLEVRLSREDDEPDDIDIDELDGDDPDRDSVVPGASDRRESTPDPTPDPTPGPAPEPEPEPERDPAEGPADEFGLDEVRLIELHATGSTWAGRWDRIVAAMEPYRC